MKLDDVELWRAACERSEACTAFVNNDNFFVFANNAWCRLVGYGESELLTKRWQDITDPDDIGSDQLEAESVQRGKEEYYLEKTYIRKDRTRVRVGLFVHRHPTIGDQKGYIVFAEPLERSPSYIELQKRFEQVENAVSVLRSRLEATEQLAEIGAKSAIKVKSHEGYLKQLIGRGEVIVGDRTTISGNSGKVNNNDSKVLVVVACVLCVAVIALGAFALGGAFSYSDNQRQVEIEGPVKP